MIKSRKTLSRFSLYRIAVGSAAIVLILLTLPWSSPVAHAQSTEKDYFPLFVGYSWKYKIAEINEDISMTVTRKCRVGTYETFGVETLRSGTPVGITIFFAKLPGKILMVGCLDPKDNKVAEFITPLEYIRTPLDVGKSWTWTEKTQDNSGKTYTQSMRVLKSEIVSVPAGTYSARHILHEYTQDGTPMKKNLWYAPDVGLVKWTVEDGKSKITTVLMEFRKKS